MKTVPGQPSPDLAAVRTRIQGYLTTCDGRYKAGQVPPVLGYMAYAPFHSLSIGHAAFHSSDDTLTIRPGSQLSLSLFALRLAVRQLLPLPSRRRPGRSQLHRRRAAALRWQGVSEMPQDPERAENRCSKRRRPADPKRK